MALSATPAPRIRARAPRSMFSDPRTGSKLVTAFVLARMSLLVLSGRVSVNVACPGHDHDRVHHRCTAGLRLDVVLAGSTDLFAPSTRTAHDPVQQQLSAPPCPQEDTAVRDRIGSPVMSVQAEEGGVLGVRRAGSASAMHTASTTLVMAGLIGLLGVAGATAFLVHSMAGPVRRAVRVLQAPAEGRLDQRLLLTTRDELPDMSRAPDTVGDGLLGAAWQAGADARGVAMASDGLTATSGTPYSSAEESPSSAGVASAGVEQVTNGRAFVADIAEIAPDVAETRSVLPEIARVVRQAQLALDATIEGARAGRADTESALKAKVCEAVAQEAAKPAEAMTAPSTPAARSAATTRYAAGRGRALGPTTALWHAVQLDRLVGAIGGACETTVCGSLVRLSAEQTWPVAARDVCPSCATLAQ